METFIATILMFGGNYAPSGWAFCNGQLLPVAQYNALFSILGAMYGGDGVTNFALPDLRGRVPLHFGTGTGLTPRNIGTAAGAETITLNQSQMPMHNHSITANDATGTAESPNGGAFAKGQVSSSEELVLEYAASLSNPVSMNPLTVGQMGNNQGHDNIQPFLAVNFIICLNGIYPARN